MSPAYTNAIRSVEIAGYRSSRVGMSCAGVIAESGTHDQLLAKGGLYAQLHEIQYQEPGAAGKPATGHPGPATDLRGLAAATATPTQVASQ